ncbi:MAG: hypothetical protein ABH872_05875 [Candidatus Omnitrophota bacterium]
MENNNHKLSTLDKRIKAFSTGCRQNVTLMGNCDQETSYLLDKLLENSDSLEIIFIRCSSDLKDKREFFKGISFSLLSEFFNSSTSLDALIQKSIGILDNTSEFIQNTLKKRALTFLDPLELINIFIFETKRKCILIIEDFSELKNLFPQCFKHFPKFITLQNNCMIVLTSSKPKETLKILSGELNLLFGNFEKIYLEFDSFIHNFSYLKKLAQPVSPSSFFLSFFVNLIGTNQLYCDIFAKSILNKYIPANEELSIRNVLFETIYDRHSYLFHKFLSNIERLKPYRDFPLFVKLLIYISQGYMRKSELSSVFPTESKTTLTKLKKLCELQYVANFGNIFKIKDSLFSFWLSNVYNLFTYPPILDVRKQKLLWENSLQTKISLFKDNFLKDNVKKVLELITAFKNDNIQSSKDKYYLPSVERIKVISYPEKNMHLIIGEGQEIIVAGLKETAVTDCDVMDFLEKSSSIKGKGVRKLLICLDRFTYSAKLTAKDNKLTIWDENDINNLMHIYNKPIISLDTSSRTNENFITIKRKSLCDT